MSAAGARALSADPGGRGDGSTIAVLATVGIVMSFMQTVLIPVYPRLPGLLGSSVSDTAWVLTATLLAGSVAAPIAGRLADLLGKKRILLVLLSVVLAGNMLAVAAQGLEVLVVARALQGLGLGAIPLSLAMLRDSVQRGNLNRGIAFVSASMGIGGALVLPLAAVVTQWLDWHWLFVFASLSTAATIILVALRIPLMPASGSGRFDLMGAILLALGLSGLLLAVSKGNEWGWGSATVLSLGAGGALTIAAWIVVEVRAAHPLVDIRVARQPAVLFANVSGISVGFGTFLVTAAIPAILQAPTFTAVGLGVDLVPAALCVGVIGGVMFLAAPLAARSIDVLGAKAVLVIGMISTMLACVVAVFWLDQVWQVIVICAIAGLGIAASSSSMSSVIMSAVPVDETAAANGFNAVVRTIGSTAAAAMIGIVLGPGSTVIHGVASPTRQAYALLFMIGAAVCLMGVVSASLLPARRTEFGR